jgi:hypothetical protein
MITVQNATPAMFEDVHALLRRFHNHAMSKEDWRRMLFQYPWPAEDENRGHVLLDGARVVGFLGTLLSTREIDGRKERFCNLSSWIVLEAYRARSLSLLAPILRLEDHTIVCSTPSPTAHRLFVRTGHRTLEDRVLLLPPLATWPELSGLRRATMTTDEAEVRAALTGEARRCFDDHRGSLGASLLLQRDGQTCWAKATLKRRSGFRFAFIQHLSNPRLFWECLPLAKVGFLKALRAPTLAVDARFARGHDVSFSLSWRLATPRLYRPAREDIRPEHVDGLYSELMGLRT